MRRDVFRFVLLLLLSVSVACGDETLASCPEELERVVPALITGEPMLSASEITAGESLTLTISVNASTTMVDAITVASDGSWLEGTLTDEIQEPGALEIPLANASDLMPGVYSVSIVLLTGDNGSSTIYDAENLSVSDRYELSSAEIRCFTDIPVAVFRVIGEP